MVLVMGYYIKKEKEPYAIIGMGTITSVFSILIILQVVSYIWNINIIDEITFIVEDVVNKQVEILKTMNVDVLSAREILDYLLMIVPGLLIIQSMVAAFGNYYITVNILRRLNFDDAEFPQFSNFRLPRNIVFGSFIIFALSYLTKYVEGIHHTNLLANVTLLFVFMFFIQGVSVISHLIRKIKIHKAIRTLLLIAILFITPLLTVVSFVRINGCYI